MNGNHLNNEIARLSKAFNHQPTLPLKDALWNVIKSYDPEYLNEAVNNLINSQTRYPPNAVIITAVREAFNADWQRSKEKDKANPQDLTKQSPLDNEFTVDARTCFKKVVHARTRFQIVTAFKDMIQKHPNKGYENELARLRKEWDKKPPPPKRPLQENSGSIPLAQ